MPIVILIKYYYNGYFLSSVVEVLPEVLPKTDNSVGIDLGIKTFATVETFAFLLWNIPRW